MRQPNFYSAVFAIIRNDKNEILFQKRQNTGFRDGQFQLPSGHVEWSESIKDSIIRELQEELWIGVLENDIEIAHIAHVISSERVYFNIYANILKYVWDIVNLESEKCSEIGFYTFQEIENNPDFQYEIETLKSIEMWYIFSEKMI